ncbi:MULTISPECIES: restriction endonuclease subunit S [Micrococcus]|nr:restriction endonuclease subunit S [Micrococcus sp. Mcc89]
MVCCIGATIGKVGIVAEQSAFNQQINAIEWGPDMDDLYGYFTMRAQSDVVAARGSSTTMPILAKSKFEELLIPVAPFEVQEGFARVASNVSRVRSNLVAAWEAERQLFASLQSRAFRGEL